jgi:hypothetical protein
MEDYFLKPKPSDPLISSISVKLPSVESGKFDLKNWGDLQDLLKQSLHVVTNGRVLIGGNEYLKLY